MRQIPLLTALTILSFLAQTLPAQTMLKLSVGWGDSYRLGHWTPLFVSVADPKARSIDLQIHGSYGEKSAAMWLHQTAVAQPRPTIYALLFPINAAPSHIEVVISDEATGKTLAAQALQDPSSFTPAGHVPARILTPRDLLIGISGEIGDALRLQSQLNQANVTAGILDPIRLPANCAGYDGISLLILDAADLRDLDGDQQRAIVQWTQLGGNLLVIPGTLPAPQAGPLIEALPCDIGQNQTSPLPAGAAATQPSSLDGRQLSPRPGALPVQILGQTGYVCRSGLGRIAIFPANISPLQFPDANSSNNFWRQALAGLVDVPPIRQPTETVVGPAEEDSLSSGPNAADSVGRGPRESVAIRNVLDLLAASGSPQPLNKRETLLGLILIFTLIGPLDSILMWRMGVPPRHWLTMVGWVGLLTSAITLGAWHFVNSQPTVRSLRLIDQIDGTAIAATDIVAIESPRSMTAPTSLDEREWWEPANQEARTFGPERFFDATCREDRQGCRPELLNLTAAQPQAWHGELADLGHGFLKADLSLHPGDNGTTHIAGTLTNRSNTTMTDIQIATASGTCRLPQPLVSGAAVAVNEELTDHPISFSGLPYDIDDISPQRADRMNALLKSRFACVQCQMPGAAAIKMVPGIDADRHYQILRAAVKLNQ